MKIHSKENLYGEYTVPSDKSITSRAIILGSIAKGKTLVVNPLLCEDAQVMINCVKKLGAKVKVKGKAIEIKSAKKLRDGQKFDCGNSGTTLRFLCGLVAGSRLRAVLSGDKALNQRPMRSIKEPLEKMGATVALTNYKTPPVLVEGESVRGIDYPMHIGSSQIKSSILLCALQGGVKTSIKEELETRNHMEILLKQMGADIEKDPTTGVITLNKSEIKGKRLYVCGDFSVAANFIALGILCGETVCHSVGVNPTRTTLLDILRRMGAKIEITNRRVLCGEPIADITAYKSKLTATHVTGEEVLKIIDEIPILAVLMGVAEGESIISGLGDIQYKDVDVLGPVDEMINDMGGDCRKFNGGLVIKGVEKYKGGEVCVHGDARIAMSAAIALSSSENGGETDDDSCVNNAFPGFFESLRKNSIIRIGKTADGDAVNGIHAYILNKMGVKNFTYSRLCMNDGNVKRAVVESKEFDGCTVNYPYGGEVAKRVPKLVDTAKIVRSVNTVKGGCGYSTDGVGLTLALTHKDVEPTGKRVLLLGCGSVAKSIACVLVNSRANVEMYNRTVKTAQDFAKKLSQIKVLDSLPTDENYDIIINATPVGGGFTSGELPVKEELVKNSTVVCDLVVAKEKTALISLAEKEQKTTVNGLEFSFFTTYYSACILTGREPTTEEAFAFLSEYLNKSV
ncbi:MAG: 3-phosphoshikimate 1-carboxyvinyltransferase [Clostridiales bacterium]|nr:3-phosphoshikimate 1-carboxyvinyltransferase [Clostridiales bacterium]